jgi:hypothetical protein
MNEQFVRHEQLVPRWGNGRGWWRIVVCRWQLAEGCPGSAIIAGPGAFCSIIGDDWGESRAGTARLRGGAADAALTTLAGWVYNPWCAGVPGGGGWEAQPTMALLARRA